MPALREKLRIILYFKAYQKTGNSFNGKGVSSGFLLIELLIALFSIALFSVALAFMQGLSSSLKRDSCDIFKATSLAERTMEKLYENPNQTFSSEDGFSLVIEKNNPFQDIPYTMASVTVSWADSKTRNKKVTLYGGWYD